ncbi:MAG: histidine phosphatase family protein, partial [Chloroflexi bacterium]
MVGDPAGEALGQLGEVRPEDRPVLRGSLGHRPKTGPLLEPVDGGGVGHREPSGGAGGAGGRGYCGPGGAESAPRWPSGENAPVPDPGPARLRLRLVRHGETDWNAEGRIQGHLDVPLNARGAEQARRVAEELAGSGAQLVLSSDLSRATQTAAIIAEHLGVPLVLDAGLRERNLGALQGKTAADLGGADGGQAFVSRMVNDPGARPEGGESLAEFRARLGGRIGELVARPPAADVVLVSHGGAIRAALLALLGTDRRDVVPRIGNCSVIDVEVAGGR